MKVGRLTVTYSYVDVPRLIHFGTIVEAYYIGSSRPYIRTLIKPSQNIAVKVEVQDKYTVAVNGKVGQSSGYCPHLFCLCWNTCQLINPLRIRHALIYDIGPFVGVWF